MIFSDKIKCRNSTRWDRFVLWVPECVFIVMEGSLCPADFSKSLEALTCPIWSQGNLQAEVRYLRTKASSQGGRVKERWMWDYVKFAAPWLDCTQYQFYYRSFELKTGFVKSFRVHLKAERVNKCEIKILTELISLNLRLINYRVCNNSLDKSIPQTCKARRAVRYMAKQQGFIKCPSFPLKINPSARKARQNRHMFWF